MKGKFSILYLLIAVNSNAQWFRVNQDTTFLNTDIFFLNADTGFVVGAYWGQTQDYGVISRTVNGGLSWDTTLVDFYVPTIYFPSINIGYCGGQDNAVYKTVDMGLTWNLSYLKLDDYSKSYFLNNDTGFTLHWGGNLEWTYNGGASWSESTNLGGSAPYPGVGSIQFMNDSVGIIADGEYGTYARTFDRGTTWQTGHIDSSMTLISIRMRNMNVGYAVGYDGKYSRTFDGGQTWTAPIVLCPYHLNDVDFFNDSVGYIVGGDGTWPFDDTQCGIILKTIDGGNNWFVEDSSYNAWLKSIFVINDSVGYAAGWHGRILKITNVNNTIGIHENMLASNTLNIYPNPASSHSEITFTYPSLGSPSEIVLNNIDGKEVVRYALPQWSNVQQLKLPKLAEGIYVARFLNEKVSANVKFVINE